MNLDCCRKRYILVYYTVLCFVSDIISTITEFVYHSFYKFYQFWPNMIKTHEWLIMCTENLTFIVAILGGVELKCSLGNC